MKILKEFIKLQIKTILEEQEKEKIGAENSFPGGWDFDFFKNKLKSDDIKERNEGVRFAEKYLDQLGYGSGKKAFDLKNGMVLKVAYSTGEYYLDDSKGIAQNKEEIELTKSNVFPEGTLAKVEEWGPNKSWLTMEKITPFRSEYQFKEETGIAYDVFRQYLKYYQEYKPKQDPIKFINDFLKKEIKEELEEEERRIKKIKDIGKQKEEQIKLGEYESERMDELSSYEEDTEKRDFLLRIFSVMERGADPRDFKYNHFGRSNEDGQIKLYDYGLSKKIWDMYY